MDVKQVISAAKARFNHNAAKQQLKDKYQSKLLVADQGGLWKATPNFLSQLSSSPAETLILLDEYDNPVKVNRLNLLNKVNEVYVTVMEEWYTESKTLENKR